MLKSDFKPNSGNSKGFGIPENEETYKITNSGKYSSLGNSYGSLSHISKNIRERKGNEEKSEQAKPVKFFGLFRYASTWDKALMVVGIITALCGGMLIPTLQIVFGNVLNTFLENAYINGTSLNSSSISYSDEFLNDIGVLCLYNVALGVFILVSYYIIVCTFGLSAANQAYKIRCLFMASILKQDIAYFDTNQTGDFASVMAGDLKKIEDGIGEKVGICSNYLSTCVFSAIVGVYYGWKLALVTFSLTPIMIVAQALLSKVQAAASREESEAYGAAGAVAEEALSSIRTVVAFGGEQKEIQRYDKYLKSAQNKGIKRGLLTSVGAGLFWFCLFTGHALAFWYGVKLVVESMGKPNPEYIPGTLIIVFPCIMLASMYFGQTASYFEAFALARGSAGKIFAVIQRKPYIDSSSKAGKRPNEINGSVSFRNVYFNYPARPDVPVLKSISFTARPGETVALVGPSGCGKSTIIQLLLRFYDAIQGSIEIDENKVRDLNVGWLRDNIGFVGQEPVLFSTTIAENIRYGKNNATLEEIEEAAKLANVHDFISNLPQKYETLVGDRGTQLSGGQKQRIAVARALIKNPKLLLLDEATSALDTESEAIVQAALDQARKGRTTIIVAHRLSTIRNADKIFVLSDGAIEEIGSHEELMEKKGLYYQLVLSQTQDANKAGDDVTEERPVLKTQISALSTTSAGSNPRMHGNVTYSDSDTKTPYELKNEDEISLNWTRLLKTSLFVWPYLVVGAVASLFMGLHVPFYGILFGSILGVLSEPKEKILDDSAIYCLLYLIMAITAFISSILQTFLFSVASERITSKFRKLVFSKMITQDIAWFDHPKNSVGSLCAKLSSDASDMQGVTGSQISTLLQAISTLSACIFIAVYYNYKIGLLVFAFVPLIVLTMAAEKRMTTGLLLSDKASIEAASKIAIEAIESIRTVAALHQEENFFLQFKNALEKTYSLTRKKVHIRAITFALGQCKFFAYAAGFYYGSTLVAKGEETYANVYRVLYSIIVGCATLGQVLAFSPDYQKAMSAAARVFQLLDMKPTIDVSAPGAKVLDKMEGKIDFQSVHFNYPSRPEVKVLRGLNLDIEPGKTVALVGSSGCGKSTCVQLIERFYEADKGDVLIENENVIFLNAKSLRSEIGLVSQEPVLFSYSIAENIAYGKNYETVNMNEIIDAAKRANIHNFIITLPQGYETPVGLKGTQLSGGQKQRVAIARALLRDPKILLLDEATSALDAESERIVQEALDNARSGRTCLIIAHRLATIQNADSIAVIHKGKVVEQGTHHELLKRKGHYYKLYNSQYSKKDNTSS